MHSFDVHEILLDTLLLKSFWIIIFYQILIIIHGILHIAQFLKLNNPEVQKGLQQFHMLIQNKLFLLIFIRTMEQDQGFTAKEKVNVASLTSCALQNRMQYHTEWVYYY